MVSPVSAQRNSTARSFVRGAAGWWTNADIAEKVSALKTERHFRERMARGEDAHPSPK
ncbi:hypothetical protein WNB94_16655 [Aquabacterium sp. A3]|uniref:hypothetical protein n=1 Tax=Aquabacterium sp. A3 TaxID=3132829 RepID=UPI00311A8111